VTEPVAVARRLVEVIADRGAGRKPRRRYGSGLLLSGRWVLTAAHVVQDAVAVQVRGPDKILLDAVVESALVGDPDRCDLALLEVPAAEDLPRVPVARVNREVTTGEVIDCWSLGYPQFMQTTRDRNGRSLRDTAQVMGQITPLSWLVGKLLSLQVEDRPQELPPAQIRLGQTEWSGMSGAAVFAGQLLVGVVSEHAPRQGPSAVMVTPVDRLADPVLGPADAAVWWRRLAVTDPTRLPLLPRRLVGSDPGRAKIRQLVAEYRQAFAGRQMHLAALDAFLDDGTRSAVLIYEPTGRGKTALLVAWVDQVRDRDEWTTVFVPVSRRYDTAEAGIALGSLAAQLADAHGETVQDLHLDPDRLRERIDELLRQPLADGRRLLVVMDGVDEAVGWQVTPALLPLERETHLKMVVSAREEADTAREVWLERLGWHRPAVAAMPTLSLLNADAILAILAQRGLQQIGTDPLMVEEVMRITQGDPLTIWLLTRDLQDGIVTAGQLPDRPAGLAAYFHDSLDELVDATNSDAVYALLGLCATAYGPLSHADLAALDANNLGRTVDRRRAVKAVGRYLVGDGSPVSGYAFQHPRLQQLYLENDLDGHEREQLRQRFIDYGQSWYADRSRPLPDYLAHFWIAHLAEAVDTTSQGHPERAMRLSNLGDALLCRFQRDGALDDLERAVDAEAEAVTITPQGHPERALYLSNLGDALLCRFQRDGALDDLERAVDVEAEAVTITPQGHPERALYLSNLGDALLCRFQRDGALDDLERAVDVEAEAVTITPQGHPERATILSKLGGALQERFERIGMLRDLDRGVEVFREAVEVGSAPVLVRADAARQWGRLAVKRQKWAEAVEGFSSAVGLMGLVASRGLEQADQEFRLGQLAGLGSEAAAACVQAGQPGRAVELFEQGRGVLFSQVLDVHTDLSNLADAHPPLAEAFVRWRDEFDRHVAADQRRVAAEFERVLSEIRALPGFKEFLAPRPVKDLMSAAAEGPVVLINVAPLRSDALILTTDRVDVLALDGVDPNGVIDRAQMLLDAIDALDDDATSEGLGWLWDKITGPVLEHLGYAATPPEASKWPRVWWCPSGPLSLLPLHAAGHHDTRFSPQPETVIDRVISSTIPTVRSLLHARQTLPPQGDVRMLVVAASNLPGAAQETDTLRHLFAGRLDVLGLPDTPAATRNAVLAALSDHTWVHFACHYAANPANPSASCLGFGDYQTEPLTVTDLIRLRLDGAELAFLSTSASAQTGAFRDEPIHLAAACQLAGYRHVIGTLWDLTDEEAAWVTRAFYTNVTMYPTSTPATALHHATRQLRSRGEDPVSWAPYIHMGP
jgi:tetratricopeptide (TPR) repeat protein